MLKLGGFLGYKKLKKMSCIKSRYFLFEKWANYTRNDSRLSGGYDSTGSGIARGLKLSEAIIKICLGERFNKKEIKTYFKSNNKKVLVISRYTKKKRLFYSTTGIKINNLFKNIKRNIEKNILLKNNKIFNQKL